MGRDTGVRELSSRGVTSLLLLALALCIPQSVHADEFMTRWAAFLCSGLMAAAYWIAHGTKAFFPLVNEGELAALYCFVFLFISARGAGIWSIDGPEK